MAFIASTAGLRWALAAALILAMGAGQARSLPDFTALARNNGPSVVNISTRAESSAESTSPGSSATPPRRGEMPEQFGDDDDPRSPFHGRSLGSGFIVASDGLVLTNYHVVRDAGSIQVRLSDRREFDAELIGADRESDLALLHIDADNLPAVTVGSAAELQVGEWVLAIGSPFGFDTSVTAGIVSAKGRNLPQENYVSFIQTDVAINPGNSGGPLFNLDGEVVAVNSHIYSRTGGFMGVSFAIPIEMAMDVVEQIRSQGEVSRGWLGVLIREIDNERAETLGMRRPVGAVVDQVVPESPAAAAGLQGGDVIVSVDGREVGSAGALPPLVGRLPIGEAVPLSIIRGGERRSLTVRLEALPEHPRAGLPGSRGEDQQGSPEAQPREQALPGPRGSLGRR